MDEDRRTRTHWYDSQHHADYTDLPHRKQDWRNHLWDHTFDGRHGNPRQGPGPRTPAGPPGGHQPQHMGPPHRGDHPGHGVRPGPGPPVHQPHPHIDEWDPKRARLPEAPQRPHRPHPVSKTITFVIQLIFEIKIIFFFLLFLLIHVL